MTTLNLPDGGDDSSRLGLSAWERLLLSADVREGVCALLVEGGTRKGDTIRSWVLANYAKRYVPEHILEVLGLRKRLVHRWHKEERQSAFSIAAGST